MGPAGGERSDAEIFRSVYPALRRFAAAVRAPGSDADDLVQEALARTLATRSLASIDEPLAYLRTAVMRIAMNATRSSRREALRIARATVSAGDTTDAYPSDLDALRALPPMTLRGPVPDGARRPLISRRRGDRRLQRGGGAPGRVAADSPDSARN